MKMSHIRKLRPAIWGGVALLVLAMILGFGSWRVSRAEGELQKVVADNSHKSRLLQQMSEAMHNGARSLRTLVLLNDPAQMAPEMEKIAAARAAYGAAAAALDATPASSTILAARARLKEMHLLLEPLNARLIALAQANRDTEAIELLAHEIGPAAAAWWEALRDNLMLQDAAGRQAAAIAERGYDDTLMLILPLAGLAVAVGVFAGLWPAGGLMRRSGRIVPANAELLAIVGQQVRSLEELAGIVRQNVDTARRAHALAAVQMVRKGGIARTPMIDSLSVIDEDPLSAGMVSKAVS